MKKTVLEKFKTKLNNFLDKHQNFVLKGESVYFQNKKIFCYKEKNKNLIILKYEKIGVSPKKINPFYEIEFELEINLNHNNLKFLSSNLSRPLSYIYKIYSKIKNKYQISKIVFGGDETKILNNSCYISDSFYFNYKTVDSEESKDKEFRVKNRVQSFFKQYFDINFDLQEIERNYSVLIDEIISSKKITYDDIFKISSELKVGVNTKIFIKEKIEKQTRWLIDILREFIDTPKINKKYAQDFGSKYFFYHKNSIKGPEHLLERILTDYGKNIIFGVPALLNTDKYIISSTGLPRVQFDIILINELSDVQIVELKRPDKNVLDFDSNRNKFYPSKELSVAIGQSERYISSILKENDEEYKINDKKIREYIEENVSGVTELFITRPTALIIIGRIQDIAKKYEKLPEKIKSKIIKIDYEKNLEQAYRELRSTHKNIKIITYSELINSAELRFIN